MLVVVILTFFINLINWLVLKELRTDYLHYPQSRKEQIIILCLLLVFNFASLQFLRFLSKKVKNVFKIFISTTLLLLSLAAFHDIVYGWGEEKLVGEFLILVVTALYFLWLKKK